jgi:hypothetical protein
VTGILRFKLIVGIRFVVEQLHLLRTRVWKDHRFLPANLKTLVVIVIVGVVLEMRNGAEALVELM